MGKILIILGIVLIVAGLLILAGLPLGQLPGDMTFKGERFRFYFPIATSILVSIVLSLLFYIFSR